MIKNYLIKPPILVPPFGKPLFLYLTTTDTTMGALLDKYLKETRKENAIYQQEDVALWRKVFTIREDMRSTCLGNPQTQTLYACLQGFVDFKNGSFEVLKEKPVQDGKIAKWVLLLSECDSEICERESNCRSLSPLFTRRSWRDPRKLSRWRHHDDWGRIMEDVLWQSHKSNWKWNLGSLNFPKRHFLADSTFLPPTMSLNMKLALWVYKQL